MTRARRVLIKGLVAFLVVAAVGFAVLYATADINRVSLGRSLAIETGSGYYNRCQSEGPRRWSCRAQDEEETYANYRVRQTSRRCWQARRTSFQFRKRSFPRAAHGCVGLLDDLEDWVDIGPLRYDAPD